MIKGQVYVNKREIVKDGIVYPPETHFTINNLSVGAVDVFVPRYNIIALNWNKAIFDEANFIPYVAEMNVGDVYHRQDYKYTVVSKVEHLSKPNGFIYTIASRTLGEDEISYFIQEYPFGNGFVKQSLGEE